jgi:hypothetical protein
LIVDTGTSEYGSGPRRQYERSTAAHNTLTIDGLDSTEVWGAFRAGRRARGHLMAATDSGVSLTITAEHHGFRHLRGSPTHRRTLEIDASRLVVDDHVSGHHAHIVHSRFLVAAPERCVPTSGGATETEVSFSTVFGDAQLGQQFAWVASGELPLRLRTVFDLRSVDHSGSGIANTSAPGRESVGSSVPSDDGRKSE